MANEVLQSLGILNSFLSNEANRVRQERKEQAGNQAASGIANMFLTLPTNSSEEDLKSTVAQSIKLAADTNTSQQNRPLIQSLYSDHLQMMKSAKERTYNQALGQSLSAEYGMEYTPALGGRGMAQLLSTRVQSTQMMKDEDSEGRTIMRTFKPHGDTYKEIGDPFIINSTTTEQRASRELATYKAKSDIDTNSRLRIEMAKLKVKSMSPDLMAGKGTKEGYQLYDTGRGMAYYDPQGSGKMLPYYDRPYPIESPSLVKGREARQDRIQQQILKGDYIAATGELEAQLGAFFADAVQKLELINDSDIIYNENTGKSTSSFRALYARHRGEIIQNIKDKYLEDDPQKYEELMQDITSYDEGMARVRAYTKTQDAIIEGKYSSINDVDTKARNIMYEKFGFNENDYTNMMLQIEQHMGEEGNGIGDAFRKLASKILNKPAEQVTFKDFKDNLTYEQQGKIIQVLINLSKNKNK